MITIRTENTKASKIHEPVDAGAEHMEKILIGEVEDHTTALVKAPDRFCRYLHIITKEAELVMELWADNEDALVLRNVQEDASYVLEEE